MPYYCTGSVGEGFLLLGFYDPLCIIMIYITCPSCRVRTLYVSCYRCLLTLLSHGLPACRLSALVAVINIALYLGSVGRGAWPQSLNLDLQLVRKRTYVELTIFTIGSIISAVLEFPHGLQGLGLYTGTHWSTPLGVRCP